MLSIRLTRTISFYLSLAVSAVSLTFTPVFAYADEGLKQEVSTAQPVLEDTVKASEIGININSADAMLLSKKLKGIGIKKAEAIVRYREVNGNFTQMSDLLKVKGIGKSILKRNQELITI